MPDNLIQRTEETSLRKLEPESLRNAPRCQARAKSTGKRCNAPSVRRKRVCRVHGAKGGAPKGEANGNFRHGGESKEAVALRRAAQRLLNDIQHET